MVVEYPALFCRCGSVINPYVQVDYRNKFWMCNFCSSRNAFPKHYADHISEERLPVELTPQCSTMEYILPNQQPVPVTFLYVIDTCIPVEEIAAVRDSI